MSFSSSQALELFVLLCITEHFRYSFIRFGSTSAYAESKSGPVRSDTMPTGLSRSVVPLQLLSHFLFPIIYIFNIVNNHLQQPPWMNALALPDVVLGVSVEPTWKNTVRMLACVASVATQRFSNIVFRHISDQFHPIGRREKPRVIQTGPYAVVRHPLYTWILAQQVLWSLMFWSYAPLLTFIVAGAVLVTKISIEEAAIQRDDGMREEYRAYMQKVPAKLVPYVW